MSTLFLLNYLVAILFCGCLNAHFARKRGKNPKLWFGLGLCFGLLSFAMLLLLPRGKMVSKEPPPKPKAVFLRRSESHLKRWFYVDGEHKQVGPMEFTDLTHLFKNRQIGKQNLIWGEGMEGWKQLRELPDLEKELHEYAAVLAPTELPTAHTKGNN